MRAILIRVLASALSAGIIALVIVAFGGPTWAAVGFGIAAYKQDVQYLGNRPRQRS